MSLAGSDIHGMCIAICLYVMEGMMIDFKAHFYIIIFGPGHIADEQIMIEKQNGTDSQP